MQLRMRNVSRLAEGTFDALIVGGGINGAVAAGALAGRGANVALIDQRDFAGFTSQHSSNLAWGGIKYMETYDFGLVRQLCKSRNQLIRSYPSTVQEIRFLTTLRRGFRHHPAKLWLGTWLYWLIGDSVTRAPRLLSATQIKEEEPIIDIDDCIGGFEYSDAYLHDNDARFVWNFIRSAMDDGCVAANYVEALGSRRVEGVWETRVRDREDGAEFTIRSRVLINATGPYVDRLNRLSGERTEHRHVYSKGIHLIVDRLTREHRVLAFFASDGRLFFVIPMGPKTCIGTTDTRVEQPEAEVTDADRQFVLDNINRCLALKKPLTRDDVIAERCGVRPLVVKAEGSDERDFLQLSRKHAIDVDRDRAHLSIFGGKLTDCINVGDEVCEHVLAMGITLPQRERIWYGEPGPALKAEYDRLARDIQLDELTPSTSSEPLSSRLWRRYGAAALPMLEILRDDPTQAQLLIEGTEYLRCEIQHAAEREMIVKLDDFLRRRSKIAQVVRREDIRSASGLLEACRILFGNRARERFDEYFEPNRDIDAMRTDIPLCSESLNG